LTAGGLAPFMESMRIAIDATALARPDPSGIRTILEGLLPALDRVIEEDGARDEIVLFQTAPRSAPRPAGRAGLRRTSWIPPRLLEALWARIDWPPFEAFAGPADIVHSLHGRLPPARRARRVLSLNDFRHHRLPGICGSPPWPGRTLARAHRFIAISEATRADAIRYLGIPPGRIVTIHLGPPPPRSTHDPETALAARRRLGLSGPYILCASSADPRKNVETAVRAVLALRRGPGLPHRLAVVGALPPGREGPLRELAGEAAVFTGVLPDPDYLAVVGGAAAIVHPSLCEGFGFPVLEGFQAGVPQAVAAGSALPEVAGPAALVFDPGDPESIAGACRRLLADPALAAALVEAGRRRLGDFSWERTARQTLEVYRSALAG
jgi:glycosyltransferase involved in cell wall biosynthesis